MSAMHQLKKRLRAGQVYRRADLARFSSSVDRHIRDLVAEGRLMKVATGLYVAPKRTRFGLVPASPDKLIERILRGGRFLLVSPNDYNGLGVGTSQLYNETLVYNSRRRGKLKIDGRVFNFCRRRSFPSKLSEEFLLVDLLNNLDRLAEDQSAISRQAQLRASRMDKRALERAILKFGSVRAKRILNSTDHHSLRINYQAEQNSLTDPQKS